MERRILQPEQIIVPAEYELANESILKMYFRVFDRGQGGILPPSVVIHRNTAGLPYHRYDTGWYKPAIEKYVEEHPEAEYFLLDGNHKSVASGLCHVPISALELLEDSDISKAEGMVKKGELFNWTVPGDTLEETMTELGGQFYFHFANIRTLRERIDELTSNGDLPQYMKERYRRVE